MAQTSASALAAALTFRVQKQVLANLRAELVWADPAYAEMGDFDAGHDTLTFVAVPDLSINTTPLTEGTKPTARAMTISTVSVSTAQYGDLVSITDLAKVKSPIEIANIASERVGRQAKESLDQVARDVIALSGTVKFGQASSVNTVRSDLATTDLIAATDLRRLRTQMYKAKIKPRSDGYYLLFIHPNVGYDLRNDTSTGGWVDVNKYSRPETLIKGELGRMEGFRIIEVVNAPTFSSTTTVYASLAVGDIKAWGAGELQSLSTYHVAPGGDHSDPLAQEELVGWKVSYGVAVLSNSYFFRLETAATSV
jgi:N4-gp56 family major capsid protein